jgi:hypothetical protein
VRLTHDCASGKPVRAVQATNGGSRLTDGLASDLQVEQYGETDDISSAYNTINVP